MKRRNIRNYTANNFNYVVRYLETEKHYSRQQAEKIAYMRFETLLDNPGGNIWAWLDKTVPAEIDEIRQAQAHIMYDLKKEKEIITKMYLRNDIDKETEKRLLSFYGLLTETMAKFVEAANNENL